MQVMYLAGPLDGAIGSLPPDIEDIKYRLTGSDERVYHYRIEGESDASEGVNIAAFRYVGEVFDEPDLVLEWDN